ncbi:MAG: nucleotidyl transferase AbiEii/AbiGii toxin family protein [Lentisphaerae bacterium]|nr:nucleotidyl transferase AbiEii/AbiGii toxin family protein [Lentisphaerota bacterium]
MKPLLTEFLKDEPNPFRRRNMMREFLQARILLAFQDHGAFANWAFVGGTALRFLFRLPRYSEDLDFSLAVAGEDAAFERHVTSMRNDLTAEAYDVAVKVRVHTTVAAAQVRFRGLLYDMGISPHRDEVFMVKVEIDTNPPPGAVTETRVLRRFVMLNLHHYDRASLLAGKLHALLTRKYTKGRDLYDLAWYLADETWPAPNLVQLNNALRQTGWEGPTATLQNWRSLVCERLATLDWEQARLDVTPFLEREQDVALVSEATLLQLLQFSPRDA